MEPFPLLFPDHPLHFSTRSFLFSQKTLRSFLFLSSHLYLLFPLSSSIHSFLPKLPSLTLFRFSIVFLSFLPLYFYFIFRSLSIVDLPKPLLYTSRCLLLKPLPAHHLVYRSNRFTVLTLDPSQTMVDIKDKNSKL
ncbi:hypothetical protein O181_068653 [Austropuccinia psidii MF-1]|uniref:Transmembrane protein n=1 Tax=Austropuccinia psidii MF-1 TaxID=1389203 RepID=A0A9Q3I5M2_9BASI|nr:hypothetical protein [Austropuccinia psidii MF-1]